MSVAPTTEITATCHCKSNVFTVAVPTSSLPLKTTLCHCTSCRHASGALNASAIPWPSPLPDGSSLQRYEFSKRLNILFCGKCSQKMFWLETDNGELSVFTSGLPHDLGLVQIQEHIFVGDTKDGGLSQWLMNPHAQTAPDAMPVARWAGNVDVSEKIAPDWPAGPGLKNEDDLSGGDSLPIRCHCGGVNLTLNRPSGYTSLEKEQVPWYVEPVGRRKWLTVVCPCDSCRTTHSADFVPLAFVDMKSIQASGSAFPTNITALSEAVARGDAGMGTLARYQSSAKAFRFHCGRCSASVFYACDSRPNLLDLAPGLIDSPDGARAEGMLWWKHQMWDTMEDFDDIRGGWRSEIGDNLELERQHWRQAKGWTICQSNSDTAQGTSKDADTPL